MEDKTPLPKPRRDLIEAHLEHVPRLARRVAASMNLPPGAEDELAAAGNLGLVEAARRYDFGRASSFLTYAYPRIRGAMVDSLRARNTITEADHLMLSARSAPSLPGDIACALPGYLPRTPEEACLRREAACTLKELVELLPTTQRRIIQGYYLRDETFVEIASDLGASKSWVSRLHSRALAQLRASLSTRAGLKTATT